MKNNRTKEIKRRSKHCIPRKPSVLAKISIRCPVLSVNSLISVNASGISLTPLIGIVPPGVLLLVAISVKLNDPEWIDMTMSALEDTP
jgi:hypothetical protein